MSSQRVLSRRPSNPVVIIADKVERKPHLVALLQNLRQENSKLPPERVIKYAVCNTGPDIALALRNHRKNTRMALIGPGLQGNGWTVARMLCKRFQVLMALEPEFLKSPLNQRIKEGLESLGVIIVLVENATAGFFKPLIENHVLSEASPADELMTMSPQERAQIIEKRLEMVSKFPTLPETQRKVSALDDLDHPKKWAEAIDPDVLTRTVILRLLNSAFYGFRSRVVSIEQAVSLASGKAIREIVLACQIRQLFAKIEEKTVEQYWKHSIATGFFAKLFSLPAEPKAQTPTQQAEFSRFRLDDLQVGLLQKARLWEKLALGPKQEPFSGGLLHDIGKITMLMCLEECLELITVLIAEEVREQDQQGKLWASSVDQIERFLMVDIDHQVIGHRLAQQWEMDAKVCEVIGFHHAPQETSSNLLKLMVLADLAANALFPYPALESQHPLPRLFERTAALARKRPAKTISESVYNATCAQFEELAGVFAGLGAPPWLWEQIDFKDFFHLCYMLAPKLRVATLGFIQQTGA